MTAICQNIKNIASHQENQVGQAIVLVYLGFA